MIQKGRNSIYRTFGYRTLGLSDPQSIGPFPIIALSDLRSIGPFSIIGLLDPRSIGPCSIIGLWDPRSIGPSVYRDSPVEHNGSKIC